jgi:AraC-like DNA-binding protein
VNHGSTIASWAGTIVRALDAHGQDGRAIAGRAGIDADALADPDARVPRAALTRLWRLAVEATDDPCFGLVVARFPLQTTFHALGYAVLASATFREALERIIRYRRLIGDIIRLDLERAGDRYRFVIDVSAIPGAVPVEAVDAVAAVTVRQGRLLHANRAFSPLTVSFQRPEPPTPEPFHRLFRAPVHFAQPATVLEYAADDMERRLPAANAELARQNDEVVVRYLARMGAPGVSSRVQKALLDALPNGEPSKHAIARSLAMSARTLQRQLAAEGTSFKAILAEARMSLAQSYLGEGRLPVTEVAFVLGFADASTFARAFKRWTGVAPRDFARQRR